MNSSDSIKTLTEYRLARAKETLNDALTLILNGSSSNSIVNRLYYACFYAALALLLSKGLETKSHEGVQRMIGLHFINNPMMTF